MKIQGIKCGEKYYIREICEGYSKLSTKYLVNGENLKTTYLKTWFVANGEPKTLSIYVPQLSVNKRYELKDVSLKSKKFPIVINTSDVPIDENGSPGGKYAGILLLYEEKVDSVPDKLKEQEFEYEEIMEVSMVKDDTNFIYNIPKISWSQSCRNITSKDLNHHIIDKLTFPDLLLSQRPCYLSSKDSYDIVRFFVKDNINPKHAEITSDYDFCFAVKKKISLIKPYKYTVDVNNEWFSKRKRKPKHVINYRSDRYVKVFEMTSEERQHEGYTPIKGFAGKTHEELKQNIDNYCQELIKFINEPVVDCPHCQGRGVTLQKKD